MRSMPPEMKATIIEMYDAGFALPEIAAAVGSTRQAIHSSLQRWNAKKPRADRGAAASDRQAREAIAKSTAKLHRAIERHFGRVA